MRMLVLIWPCLLAEILDAIFRSDWSDRLVTWIERKNDWY